MTESSLILRLRRRVVRLARGGDLVAKYEVNRALTIHHLTNPFSIYFAFTREGDHCTLSAVEAVQVADLLNKIVETEHQGASQ